MRFLFPVTLGSLALLSCSGQVPAGKPSTLDTYSSVVKRVRETYATCKSYRDRATFTWFLPPRQGTFATAFQREPRLFRFDNWYRLYSPEEDHDFILSVSGKTNFYKGDSSAGRPNEASAIGIVGPTTGFFGSSIPELLLPDVFKKDPFAYLQKPTLDASVLIGEDCYIIKGEQEEIVKDSAPPETWAIWVRKRDYLIIRMDFDTSSVTIRPELNPAIDSKVFSRDDDGR